MFVPTTIPVYFGGSTAVALCPGLLTQGDYGQKLLFADLELPDAYEVFFSNVQVGGTAKPQIGDATGVTIPDEYINGGNIIYAWLFLHAGEDDGRTMRTVSIPVTAASRHVETPPTPVQQGVIDQAIAALNAGVTAAEAAVEHYPKIENGYWYVWDAENGEWSNTNIHAQGPQGEPGADGQDGAPGEPGRDGTDGQDGTSAYVYIRYAAAQPTADADMKTTPDAWMGIYSGDSPTAPEHYTDYTWYNIKGQTGPVSDVQVNGTSVVSGGVANVPVASTSDFGVVKIGYGLQISSNILCVAAAGADAIRAGANNFSPISPFRQHRAVFYGLAKAAGTDSQTLSQNAVGTYTESAKSAISQMLSGSVAVSGSTPTINAKPGISYVCGECSTLDIAVPESGCFDVAFESGSTPTALSIPMPTGYELIWLNGFDDTSLDANTVYEINLRLLGTRWLGVAGQWAT